MSDTISVEEPASRGSRKSRGRELTGRHVLAMLLVFFGLIICSAIVFTTLAVTSFRGEDVKKSYRQGIDYNQTLAERAVQAQLGWQAAVNVTGEASDRTLIVKVTDGPDRALFGADFTGRLRHPVDTDLDRALDFQADGNGMARADISGLYGQWTLQGQAELDGQSFAFSYGLDLR